MALTPRPLILNFRPTCVPAGIFKLMCPVNVEALAVPPTLATGKEVTKSQYRSLPLRVKKSCSNYTTSTNKSPRGAPNVPGLP